MAEVRLESVGKRFGEVVAVDGLSLTVADGELVSLLGPSGSGKTTTLRLIAGYDTTAGGEIFLDGRPVGRLPAHRRNIGMVFQHYALFPHLTVFGNVAFGLRMRRVPAAETRRRVAEALALVRLEGLEGRYPRQLSGGQQQRVALARAIVIGPRLLLLDEPLSALDRKLRAQMQLELRELQRRLGLTTLYVTHDQEEALALSDRVAVMNAGRLQQYGSPREIYERPANAFVADFIGVANLFDADLVPNGADGPQARQGRLIFPSCGADDAARPGRRRLALRPEQVRLGRSPSPGAMRARVTNAVYLGTSTHVYVDLEGGPSLVAFVQNTGPSAETFSPGSPVWVSWDPDSLRLIRE
jgi:spermidine/putrescine ABC transporter ATP-binding subunit